MPGLAGRITSRSQLTSDAPRAYLPTVENHIHALTILFMFYNFRRLHSTIKTSPAVPSRITDHVWSVEELIGLPDCSFTNT